MTKNSFQIAKYKVGVTVLIGLIIFFIFIFLVGSEGLFFSETYNLNLKVQDTEGLVEGGKVSLGNLKVGEIEKIKFIPKQDSSEIIISITILKKYSEHITKSSKVKISTIGLLGDKYINISVGKSNEEPLANAEYIPVSKSFNIENITQQIEPMIHNVNRIITNLGTITDSIVNGNGVISELVFNKNTGRRTEAIINNLESLSTAINQQKGTIGKLAYDAELYNNLTSITDNLISVSDSLQNGRGTFGKLIAQDSLYNSLDELIENLNLLFSASDSDSTVVTGLMKDKKLYVKLNTLIEELNTLIVDIKENPDRYLNISVF